MLKFKQVIDLLILIETLVYLIFFILKLYSLVDKSLYFSTNGSKLEKYINKSDMQSTTCNFEYFKTKHSIKDFFQIAISPKLYKHVFITLLVSMTIIVIKLALTYRFLISNFFYITIFNKYIDFASVFAENYIYFKISHYFLFSFFIFNITNKVVNKYFYSKKIEKEKTFLDISNKCNLVLGIDKNNNNVYLDSKGLYQNVLITGSIGTGKTSGAISNILEELIKKNIYGLVIDVKGNYVETVEKMCEKHSKIDKLIKISLDSNFIYNPLNKPNISSYELASNMKRVLTLMSMQNVSDSFWLDKAESIIRDLITIIRTYTDNVNFAQIHKLVIDKIYLQEKIEIIKSKILNNEFSEIELFNINSAISNIKNEYFTLDERTLGIIKAEITRITNIFVSDYNLYNKFCSKGDILDFTKNNIVVLSISIGEHKELSKLIATYLKIDFQKQILSLKFSKSIFFICDEYQEIANSEDAHFFSISREYKCINIISMQSYSSLNNTLNNENASRVIIQNLVNKIWLRNDDMFTVSEIIKQIGKEKKETKTLSYSESGQNTRYSMISNKFKNYKSGLSQSYSLAEKTEYIYTEDYFTRILKTFEAVCMLSDGTSIVLNEKVLLKRWGDNNEFKNK